MSHQRPRSLQRTRFRGSTLAPWGTTQSRTGTHKFGRNGDISTATVPEDIWDLGGAYPWPDAEEIIALVSTSAEDTLTTGTGAWKVKIIGCDGAFNYQEETVEMDGLTPVNTVNKYFRVWRLGSITAGSVGSNVGNITAANSTDTLAHMAALEGSTLMAVYTVPLSDHSQGYDLLEGELLGWSCRVEGGGATRVSVVLQIREQPYGGAVNTGAWRTIDRDEIAPGEPGGHAFLIPTPVSDKADIRVRVISSSSNNAVVQADFDIFVYRPI